MSMLYNYRVVDAAQFEAEYLKTKDISKCVTEVKIHQAEDNDSEEIRREDIEFDITLKNIKHAYAKASRNYGSAELN